MVSAAIFGSDIESCSDAQAAEIFFPVRNLINVSGKASLGFPSLGITRKEETPSSNFSLPVSTNSDMAPLKNLQSPSQKVLPSVETAKPLLAG